MPYIAVFMSDIKTQLNPSIINSIAIASLRSHGYFRKSRPSASQRTRSNKGHFLKTLVITLIICGEWNEFETQYRDIFEDLIRFL